MDLIGFIKLHRALLNSEVFKDPVLLKVWIWCLCKARYADDKVNSKSNNKKLKKGQFLTGRKSASTELGLAESRVYRAQQKLKNMGNLNIKSNNKYSIITIVNWDTYQGANGKSEQQSEQQESPKGAKPAQQAHSKSNTFKEYKEREEYKEKKRTLSPYPLSEDFESPEPPERTEPPPAPQGGSERDVSSLLKNIGTGGFDLFWEAYPRKSGRGAAEKAWAELKPNKELIGQIVASVERQKRHNDQWHRAKGRFVPNPEKFLAGKCWLDECTEVGPEINVEYHHAAMIHTVDGEDKFRAYCARKGYDEAEVRVWITTNSDRL